MCVVVVVPKSSTTSAINDSGESSFLFLVRMRYIVHVHAKGRGFLLSDSPMLLVERVKSCIVVFFLFC